MYYRPTSIFIRSGFYIFGRWHKCHNSVSAHHHNRSDTTQNVPTVWTGVFYLEVWAMCKLKPFPYNDNFATVQIYLNPSIYTVTFPQTTFTISYKNIFSIYFVQKKLEFLKYNWSVTTFTTAIKWQQQSVLVIYGFKMLTVCFMSSPLSLSLPFLSDLYHHNLMRRVINMQHILKSNDLTLKHTWQYTLI